MGGGGRPSRSWPSRQGLRPLLCLLAYEGTAGGRELTPALAAAAGIELIHNFSLVHDDIQDEDRERHHRPTAWVVWERPRRSTPAMDCGRSPPAPFSPRPGGVRRRGGAPAYTMLNDACLTMIEGQSSDLVFEQEGQVDTARYLDMIARKTGALIATALAIGGLLGSHDIAVAAGFHELGAQLGRAFQIQDDILGVWGAAEVTGKSNSSDIRRRKQSYPVVYTLTEGPAAARAALAEVYAAPVIGDREVARAVAAMEAAGARDRAAALAAEAHARALAILDRLPVRPDIRDDLHTVAAFLLQRQF
ncbi:MAG: polyprenyl synthetase family protein [Dehalococcoidia bacterium]